MSLKQGLVGIRNIKQGTTNIKYVKQGTTNIYNSWDLFPELNANNYIKSGSTLSASNCRGLKSVSLLCTLNFSSCLIQGNTNSTNICSLIITFGSENLVVFLWGNNSNKGYPNNTQYIIATIPTQYIGKQVTITFNFMSTPTGDQSLAILT